MQDYLPENYLPHGPIQLIAASGLLGWLICLMVPFLFVFFIVANRRCNQRLRLIYLGLSFLPIFLGMVSTFASTMSVFHTIAVNPTATGSDLAAGIYIAYIPILMGAIVSGVSVFGACICMTIAKDDTSAQAEPTKGEAIHAA